jgi:hypothetical protein
METLFQNRLRARDGHKRGFQGEWLGSEARKEMKE